MNLPLAKALRLTFGLRKVSLSCLELRAELATVDGKNAEKIRCLTNNAKNSVRNWLI
jgi:hypothetical protein